MLTIEQGSAARQGFETETGLSPIDSLIQDLRTFREGSISKDNQTRRRSAILAGQIAILAREYQTGKRPNRRTLKRFLYFVSREAA